MSLRALRHRCAARLRDLALPDTFSTDAFATAVADLRGRPVHVLPHSTTGPCGAWVSTAAADYVFVDESTSGVHRRHILAHELAHVVFDHGGPDVLADDVAARLLPDVDRSTIERVLQRSSYSTEEEREAEVFASMVLQRMPALDALPHAASREVQALARSFGAARG
ncbi:ImmA/IrrE family metallo-endopeptidase [Kineococcus indalonis]|uniref:ImmA/IrrE family metallo-endopeptidase n=1 Tax=Kineococcus indalonis TaxID=2696566 RepID=UPI0014129B2C|nr:ImmA/IrrE family metallo-endopeptidase [Kineococcus indalonis]NAZ85847.1 ImmA/IrrE family metallo-endopeptidase [Kineococcus indalonis]